MNIYELRTKSIKRLSDSPTPELDVDLIMGSCLCVNRTWIMFHRNVELTEPQITKIESLIEKRTTGLPVAYITGHKEFYGYDFFVTTDVLIPKPDTEILVGNALDSISTSTKSICDICSGSGCVGLSVYRSLLDSGIKYSSIPNFTFIDISEKALEVSKRNAAKLLNPISVEKIEFVKSDLFEALDKDVRFDLILTNPPYVPTTQANDLLKDGRSEPILALDGLSEDGLALIRRLTPQAYNRLNDGGILIMETGEYNAEATTELFKECGFKNIRIERDLNEMMRNVIGTK